MTTVYDDIAELISSVGMNVIVIAGIIVDYRDKRKEEIANDDDDIPICFI